MSATELWRRNSEHSEDLRGLGVGQRLISLRLKRVAAFIAYDTPTKTFVSPALYVSVVSQKSLYSSFVVSSSNHERKLLKMLSPSTGSGRTEL